MRIMVRVSKNATLRNNQGFDFKIGLSRAYKTW
jgi:hypothetical protein